MIFVVDEDLPRSLSRELRALSLNAVDVREIGLRGKTDHEIIEYCRQNSAILITADLDFARFFRFSIMRHAGTIILRYPSELPTQTIVSEVRTIFQKVETQSFVGYITIIEPGMKMRYRRPFAGNSV